MNAQQRHLYAQLVQWHPDDSGSAFPFSKRLARENGWTTSHARRVIEEYKRFVFLAVHAGHPVTPSDAVDQAWHLHLTYTQSYWEDLCENMLQRRLHHTPTKGGRREGEKYADLYGLTLQSYQDYFGEAPPADIWPAPGARFETAPHQRWVDTRRYWLVPHPSLKLVWHRGQVLPVVAAGLLLGCATADRNDATLTLSLLGGLLLVVAVALYVHFARRPRRSLSGGGDTGSSWFSDSGGGSAGTATAAGTAAGFTGMGGGKFGGGGSEGSYGDNGNEGGGDGGGGGDGDGGGGGCSGGCGGGGD